MSEPYPYAPSCPPLPEGRVPFCRVCCPPIESVKPVRTFVSRTAWDDAVIALSMLVAAGLDTSASELRRMSGIPLPRTLAAICRIETLVEHTRGIK